MSNLYCFDLLLALAGIEDYTNQGATLTLTCFMSVAGAGGRNPISLAFNQVPMVQARPNSNATWDFTSNSKFTQEKLGLFSPTKSGGIDALHTTHNDPQETGFKLSYGSLHVMPRKSATPEVFHQGEYLLFPNRVQTHLK